MLTARAVQSRWNWNRPDVPGRLSELFETHTADVVLIGDRAYKIKKPVELGFLDFRTERARAQACRREMELNRRLAPDVETLFLMTGEESFYVSSSLVKEVGLMGGDVSRMVPPSVAAALTRKRKQGVAP